MNEVVHTSPTIGSNVEEVIWKNIHFLMWDIGGQESLRSAWSTYYTNAEVGQPQRGIFTSQGPVCQVTMTARGPSLGGCIESDTPITITK